MRVEVAEGGPLALAPCALPWRERGRSGSVDVGLSRKPLSALCSWEQGPVQL